MYNLYRRDEEVTWADVSDPWDALQLIHCYHFFNDPDCSCWDNGDENGKRIELIKQAKEIRYEATQQVKPELIEAVIEMLDIAERFRELKRPRVRATMRALENKKTLYTYHLRAVMEALDDFSFSIGYEARRLIGLD